MSACYLDYYGSLVREAFGQTVGIAKLQELPLTLVLTVLGVGVFVLSKRYIEQDPVKDWKSYLLSAVVPVILVFGGRFLYNAMYIPIERQEAVEQTSARKVEDIKIKNSQTIDRLKSQIEDLKADQNHQKEDLMNQIGALKDNLNRQKDQANQDLQHEKELTNQVSQRCNQEKQEHAANLAAAINAIEKDNYPQRLLDAKAEADAATARKVKAEAEYDSCRKVGAMGCPSLFGNMQRIEQEELAAKGQFGQVVSELDSHLNALRGL